MIFVDARCPVQSCPHNHGGDGCSCGFAGYNVVCAHPRFKTEWWDRTGGIVSSVDGGDGGVLRDSCESYLKEESQLFRNSAPEPEPARSLTARAAEAQRATVEMTAAEAAQRALQLALELEV